jgi:hypothetical protein
MSTQNEISERVQNMIGADLWDKYPSESFEDMAEIPELEQWKDELLQAAKEWWEAEQ